MLLPSPTVAPSEATGEKVPLIARFLPSLTDIAFLMPIMFLFIKLDGARSLLGDGDTGWHVRTGEWILAHHQVPHVDMFSYSRPGAPCAINTAGESPSPSGIANRPTMTAPPASYSRSRISITGTVRPLRRPYNPEVPHPLLARAFGFEIGHQ